MAAGTVTSLISGITVPFQVGVVLCSDCYSDDILASESYFSTVEDIFELNNIAIKDILKLGKGAKREDIAAKLDIFVPIARGI